MCPLVISNESFEIRVDTKKCLSAGYPFPERACKSATSLFCPLVFRWAPCVCERESMHATLDSAEALQAPQCHGSSFKAPRCFWPFAEGGTDSDLHGRGLLTANRTHSPGSLRCLSYGRPSPGRPALNAAALLGIPLLLTTAYQSRNIPHVQ